MFYVVIFLTILSSLESISTKRYQESDHILIPSKRDSNIFTKRDTTTCDVPKWFGCGETKVRFLNSALPLYNNSTTKLQHNTGLEYIYVQRYERRCTEYEKRRKIKCRVDNECRTTTQGEFSYCDMSGTCFSRSCACLPGRPRRENRPSNVSVHLNCGDRSSSSFSPTLVSDKVYWLHVPKAGTSFLNTIFHWACPRVPSEIFLAKGIRSFYHRNWQQWAWCDVEFTDITPGHFPYVVFEREAREFLVIVSLSHTIRIRSECTLKNKLNWDENSNTNARTQVRRISRSRSCCRIISKTSAACYVCICIWIASLRYERFGLDTNAKCCFGSSSE